MKSLLHMAQKYLSRKIEAFRALRFRKLPVFLNLALAWLNQSVSSIGFRLVCEKVQRGVVSSLVLIFRGFERLLISLRLSLVLFASKSLIAKDSRRRNAPVH